MPSNLVGDFGANRLDCTEHCQAQPPYHAALIKFNASVGLTMRMPWYCPPMLCRCLSPETIRSACAATAQAMIWSSSGSFSITRGTLSGTTMCAMRLISLTMQNGVKPARAKRVENFSRESTSNNSASSTVLLHSSNACALAPSSRRRGGPPAEITPEISVLVSRTTRTIRCAALCVLDAQPKFQR